MEELFTLPEPDLDELSFSGSTDQEITAWLGSLPMANIGETSRQLFHALGEMVHLRTDAETRFSLLEASRASMHYVGRSLEKHFVTNSVILEEKQLRIANLVQTMQIQLASGYQLVVRDMVATPDNIKPEEEGRRKQLLATAVHRAISELGLTVLRSCQMYASAPKLAWLKLHQLYAIAEQNSLLTATCLDPENHYRPASGIEDAYKRLLLLGCCKPNQLRQKELAYVYQALEHWSGRTKIHQKPVSEDLFSFHLTEDRLVSYRKLSGDEGDDPYWRGLCTEQLVGELKGRCDEMEETGKVPEGKGGLEVPDGITLHIMNHLLHSWGAFFERGDGRQTVNDQISVCIGLTAVQYFLSGMINFETQMTGGKKALVKKKNPFMDATDYDPTKDAWSNAFDAGGGGFKDINVDRLEDLLGIGSSNKRAGPQVYKKKTGLGWEELADETPTQPLFELNLVDTSPGGRCISWGAQPSDRVQDGQIVAFRMDADDPWTVAVVRWIQHRDNELRTGVEILAQQALGCGVAVIMRDRPTPDFLRALELPAMESVGQKATLLVPNVPFKEDQKVFINRRGKQEKAILERCLFSTGSIARFEYRSLELSLDKPVDQDKKKADASGGDAAKADENKNKGAGKVDDNFWDDL